jgi:hypothetical protein
MKENRYFFPKRSRLLIVLLFFYSLETRFCDTLHTYVIVGVVFSQMKVIRRAGFARLEPEIQKRFAAAPTSTKARPLDL